ncbi:MAG: hypothetical protein IPN88_04635 [Bacteroidetes bacterium]|nr:hypothetical protein [Bacteroidota bacterium]
MIPRIKVVTFESMIENMHASKPSLTARRIPFPESTLHGHVQKIRMFASTRHTNSQYDTGYSGGVSTAP